MSKIDVGQAITVLANVGVIASILFLGLEIRQNTQTQRLSAAQQVFGLAYTNSLALAADPANSEILFAWIAGQELTPVERNRLDLSLQAIMTAHRQVHYQYESGFLDQEIFDAYERRAAALFQEPLAVGWWVENQWRFAESFQDYVDGVIERNR